jgi:hypothetical protein
MRMILLLVPLADLRHVALRELVLGLMSRRHLEDGGDVAVPGRQMEDPLSACAPERLDDHLPTELVPELEELVDLPADDALGTEIGKAEGEELLVHVAERGRVVDDEGRCRDVGEEVGRVVVAQVEGGVLAHPHHVEEVEGTGAGLPDLVPGVPLAQGRGCEPGKGAGSMSQPEPADLPGVDLVPTGGRLPHEGDRRILLDVELRDRVREKRVAHGEVMLRVAVEGCQTARGGGGQS